MNPKLLFSILAWIAIIALSISVLSDFWLPMLCGAVAVTLLGSLVATPRR